MKSKCKKRVIKIVSMCLLMMISLTACEKTNHQGAANNLNNTVKNTVDEPHKENVPKASVRELEVRFGDSGAPFLMHLYDNETAAAIAGYVGTAEWRLPIYHYNDYENWEVMQYYDIPDRYKIPSVPERITAETVGTVYYSQPNRIVLFYGDAQIHADYTPVGYFDVTEEFIAAVENNPVLEGWGNKIVHISSVGNNK